MPFHVGNEAEYRPLLKRIERPEIGLTIKYCCFNWCKMSPSYIVLLSDDFISKTLKHNMYVGSYTFKNFWHRLPHSMCGTTLFQGLKRQFNVIFANDRYVKVCHLNDKTQTTVRQHGTRVIEKSVFQTRSILKLKV